MVEIHSPLAFEMVTLRATTHFFKRERKKWVTVLSMREGTASQLLPDQAEGGIERD